jgi:nucleoside-diphosphate-sugar epimerase
LYSGESRACEVVVVDNRFISERVNWLKRWGIRFIHGSITDEKLMEKVLSNANVIHHLAGITDVAYTKNDINPERDKLITEVGVKGTQNIIKYGSNARIIFPSSHVVFEGIEETKFLLTERDDVFPELTYSKGKFQSEKDLIKDHDDFVIFRLGSVYGYSTDTTRINIMPNLFSKIASQTGTIKLFGGGLQYKSLVHVVDVARAFKFFSELTTQKCRRILNLSNENVQVKDVADICKEVNPEVTIASTDDVIPNLGYTLSNNAILSYGFKFNYNLTSAIAEMISKWTCDKIRSNSEQIFKGQNDFVDERGRISNFELSEPINLIGYIESKGGSIRANHYHPVQEQKCLLVKGMFISVTKDLLKADAKLEYQIVREGDLSVIPPNVAHAMVFVKDSVFLNLVNGEREHKNYGITHTIPYKLVDEEMAKWLLM